MVQNEQIFIWAAIGIGAFIALGGLGWFIKRYFKATDGTKVDFKVTALSGDVLILGRELPSASKEIRSHDIAEVLIYMNNGKLGSTVHIDSSNTDKYKEYSLQVSAMDLVAFCRRNNITCVGEERETGATEDLSKRN